MNQPNINPGTEAPQGEQGSATSRAVAGGLAVTLALGAGGTAAVHHGADPTKLLPGSDPVHEITQQMPESIYDASGQLREGIRLKVAGDKLQPLDPEDGIVDIITDGATQKDQSETASLDFGGVNPADDPAFVIKSTDPNVPDQYFVIKEPGIKPNVLANAIQTVPLALGAEAERQVYGNPVEDMPTPKPPHPNTNPKGGE